MSLSGIAQFISGAPSQYGNFTTVDNADLIGGDDGQRVNETCDPTTLAKGERTFDRWFTF